jgi:hypothetical protein
VPAAKAGKPEILDSLPGIISGGLVLCAKKGPGFPARGNPVNTSVSITPAPKELEQQIVQIHSSSSVAHLQSLKGKAMISSKSKSRSTSTTSTTFNPPKFRPGFTGSNGKPTLGFYYVWHDGKQCPLTKYGAPREEVSGRAYHASVIPAYTA